MEVLRDWMGGAMITVVSIGIACFFAGLLLSGLLLIGWFASEMDRFEKKLDRLRDFSR